MLLMSFAHVEVEFKGQVERRITTYIKCVLLAWQQLRYVDYKLTSWFEGIHDMRIFGEQRKNEIIVITECLGQA
jgi:hypothetical protein